mmetsp:Transcript_420/g.1176  ORF Transcript_420/g.1176 Transcript_420/m.1176 type:complete len:239 (+) Transcript_420:404-1120(+)
MALRCRPVTRPPRQRVKPVKLVHHGAERPVHVQHPHLRPRCLLHEAVVPRIVCSGATAVVVRTSQSREGVDLATARRKQPCAQPAVREEASVQRILMEALVAAVQGALGAVILRHHHLQIPPNRRRCPSRTARAHDSRRSERGRQRSGTVAARYPSPVEGGVGNRVVLSEEVCDGAGRGVVMQGPRALVYSLVASRRFENTGAPGAAAAAHRATLDPPAAPAGLQTGPPERRRRESRA